MSFDLLIFDANSAPMSAEEFATWLDDQAGKPSRPDDISPPLRAWFGAMRLEFPCSDRDAEKYNPELEAHMTEYDFIGSAIEPHFAWSIAEQALAATKKLAAAHGVGVVDFQDEGCEVWWPDGAGGLSVAFVLDDDSLDG